ncbi:MAG: CAP domain-containing protein [Aggregatilineales bacterium]
MKHKHYFLSLFTLILFTSLLMVVHAQTATQPLPDAAGLLPEFNRWRNTIGIHSYQEDVRLSTSAQFHSEDMSDRAYFSHDAPSAVDCNGVSVSQQQNRAACFGTWSSGEGIAGGYSDADSATRGWISSYGHCTGVMNSVATHMGGGYATGDDGNKWTFQFNGAQELDPPVDHEAFCSCTSGKDSEGDIQACVNSFTNNVTPVIPEIIPLERPLPRFPGEPGESYGNTGNGSQAMCCFTFHPGVVTFRIVPVTGNPEGVMLELADANFDVIPGVSGTDSFTHEVTSPSEFAIWYSSGSIAEGSTFYIEAEWNPPGYDPNNPPAEETVNEPANDTSSSEATGSNNTVESSCSQNGTGEETTFTVTNISDMPVTVAWINYDCEEAVYGNVAPGDTFTQGTFVGHDWVIRDVSNQVVIQFAASSDGDDIAIEAGG